MSELMRPLPFAQLMRWALAEYRAEGRIFGLDQDKFYRPAPGAGLEIFGQKIATPLGPAAGPNSQLAQNILVAYLAGGRFVELKTVQQMDGAELRACIPRPCIQAEDEGYNVEWSTELTVMEAQAEYIKAWLAVQVLAKECGLAAERDLVFNMSVGYDLAGIQTAKIDGYIEGLKDASATAAYWEGIAWLKENLGLFRQLTAADIADISPCVSNSVTLSTLHGCPPAEIERIARYLLTEKRVHTYVKCNPTLLGYAFSRNILNEMGYGYLSFDSHHFENDLQYADAKGMLQRLLEVAASCGLSFGVKLTNTFPVRIERAELPGEEMYLSGRALYPLSINVAARLAGDFGERLPISYSGGADAFNIGKILQSGIRPITVSTTILKPGGYARLKQLAELLQTQAATAPARVDAAALAALAAGVSKQKFYRKEHRPAASRKTASRLPLFDCFQAPCQDGGCPIEQQIPAYLARVAAGEYAEAFRIIAVDNAAPSITGAICNHACQDKCTRLDYDDSLRIRQAKGLAAAAAQQDYLAAMRPKPLVTDKKAVVIGAGPAGIAAALFLRRNGLAVTVLEKRAKPYGMVEYLIPDFRIEAETIRRDFALAERAGVEFRFGVAGQVDLAALRREYDFVVLAVGAWRAGVPVVNQGQERLLDALAFLAESKANGCAVSLGRRVAIIGGGDVAMDCARAAKRAPGVQQVTIVYRRTQEFMPAQPEEIRLALAEGVGLIELLAPQAYDGEHLACERMQLGDWEAGGRRSIRGTGQTVELLFDRVISATGARIDSDFFAALGLELDARGQVQIDAANQTSQEDVYLAGDCKAGPATVVAAIADAKHVAGDILAKLGLTPDFARVVQPQPLAELYAKKGLLVMASDGAADAARCLGCGQLCELCCDVCPNRANLRLPLPGFADAAQILHLDGLCNECGNCGVFCPHAGAPYQDKLTLFWVEEGFADSHNRGFWPAGAGAYRVRLEDGRVLTCPPDSAVLPAAYAAVIRAVEQQYPYLLG